MTYVHTSGQVVLEVLISPSMAQRHALHVEMNAKKAFMLSDQWSVAKENVFFSSGRPTQKTLFGFPKETESRLPGLVSFLKTRVHVIYPAF